MKFYLIFKFILSFFFLSVSMIILKAGYLIYGSDANILWAMGIISFIGLNGIAKVFGYFVKQEDLE